MTSKALLRLATALTAWEAVLVVGAVVLPKDNAWDDWLGVAIVLPGMVTFAYWCSWAEAGAAEGGKWALRANRVRKALAHEE